MLNLIVGLVLVFLLYSLFASAILELIASFMSLRGKNLEKTLRNMLDPGNPGVFQEFRNNPLYQQLSGKFIGKITPPSYLPSEKFRSILFQVLDRGQQGGDLDELVGKLPDGSLKSVLQQLIGDARNDKEEFKNKVELWFNDVMDRASGWYKRNTQRILILVGVSMAVIFNVDSLEIYGSLSRDPETASKLALEATQIPGVQTDSPTFQQEVTNLLAENMEVLKSPVGIGWENVVIRELTPLDWAMKVFGWLVTALAISLGAPFWFDILKKMVNVRSSGKAIAA